MLDVLYWLGVGCAAAAMFLSLRSLMEEKMKKNRKSEIVMSVLCLATVVLWALVCYLALDQLFTWGQCL